MLGLTTLNSDRDLMPKQKLLSSSKSSIHLKSKLLGARGRIETAVLPDVSSKMMLGISQVVSRRLNNFGGRCSMIVPIFPISPYSSYL